MLKSPLRVEQDAVVDEEEEVGEAVAGEVLGEGFADVVFAFAAAEVDVFLEEDEMEEAFPAFAGDAAGTEDFEQLAFAIEDSEFFGAVFVEVGGEDGVVGGVFQVGLVAAGEGERGAGAG